MATVCVHGPLKRLTGGRSEHRVDGESIEAVLAALEHHHPALYGWMRDERGRLRRHINVYVNGERGCETTTVGPEDRVEVLPAISGGGL